MSHTNKRGWSVGSSVDEDSITVISDGEGPPRKKKKSVTPKIDTRATTLDSSFRSTSIPSPKTNGTTNATIDSRSVKKPTPWKHRPAWQQQDSTSADHDRPITIKVESTAKTSQSTDDNSNRMRELSLSQESSTLVSSWTTRPAGDSASYGDAAPTQSTGGFKFNSVASLKFNPTNGNPVPDSIGVVRAQKQNGVIANKVVLHKSQHVSRKFASVSKATGIAKSPPLFTGLTSSYAPIPRQNIDPDHLLSKSNQPPTISINVPLTDAAKLKKDRKALQERLKQGTDYAKRHPTEVERLLGLTGFSSEFTTDVYKEKMSKAAQPKARAVRARSEIPLNMAPFGWQPPPSDEASAFIHPREQAKAILTARFSERFEPPLTFSNTVNDRRLNGKFQFVSEYVLRRGVRTNGHIDRPGCQCQAHCHNDCLCLRKAFKDEKTKTEWYESIPQYEKRPDGLVVLRDDFISRYTIIGNDMNEDDPTWKPKQRVEITECNKHCPCDESCTNRVVQRGRTVPLEIFETNRCGFGVRSLKRLVKGQFIELYLGEVITEADLLQREEAAEAGSTSYIYSLDWFSPQQPYHVDGENFGSAMRFVNHSCDPNAGTFTVLNEKSTKQLHHVAFFAIKDIPAGTEITIDYTPQATGTTYDLNEADDDMEKCYCGAKNCRQMLWLPGKERKARKKLVGRTVQ